MLKNVELCGYRNPTPIQAYTIPAVLTGHDVVGIAQTGKFGYQTSITICGSNSCRIWQNGSLFGPNIVKTYG